MTAPYTHAESPPDTFPCPSCGRSECARMAAWPPPEERTGDWGGRFGIASYGRDGGACCSQEEGRYRWESDATKDAASMERFACEQNERDRALWEQAEEERELEEARFDELAVQVLARLRHCSEDAIHENIDEASDIYDADVASDLAYLTRILRDIARGELS
jgi:hypothetical protein